MATAVHRARDRHRDHDDEAVWRLLFGAAGSLALVAITVVCLLPFRGDLNNGTVALIMLAAPIAAANGGLPLALVVAAFSALAFNFFFTHPYSSLRIEDSASVA